MAFLLSSFLARSMPSHRFFHLTSLLTITLLAATLLTYRNEPLTWLSSLTDDRAVPLDSSDSPRPNMCTPSEMANGHWVSGDPVTNMEDLQARYGYSSDFQMTACNINYEHFHRPPHHESPEYAQAGFERLLRLAEARFAPSRAGCGVFEWDVEAVIKRGLRSRGGISMVGDSMSVGHMLAFHFSVGYPDDWSIRRSANHLWVNAETPRGARLLAEAGVSPERAERPFYSFWQYNRLLNPTELEGVFDHAPDRVHIDDNKQEDWFPEFEESLSHPIEWLPNAHQQGIKEEPTILLAALGPHWNHARLGEALQDEDMWMGYEKALARFEHKIRSVKSPVAMFFRTNPPGQIDCHMFDEYDNDLNNSLSPIDLANRPYDFTSFYYMNAMIQARHTDTRSSRAFDFMDSPSSPIDNPPYTVLDVWPMGLKRPEAHTTPPMDCLHFCQPGVPNEWNTLFWHQVMLEARNGDYHTSASDADQ